MAEPNYTQLYKSLIKQEKRIPRSDIGTNNVYRISTYKDVEGDIRRLSGDSSVLFFVSGKFEGKLYGLKMSLIKPQDFFRWSKDIITHEEVLEEDRELIKLDELAEPRDTRGEYMYNKFIKTSSVLKKPKIPFRTYKTSGIRYVSEVYFKKTTLELYYG